MLDIFQNNHYTQKRVLRAKGKLLNYLKGLCLECFIFVELVIICFSGWEAVPAWQKSILWTTQHKCLQIHHAVPLFFTKGTHATGGTLWNWPMEQQTPRWDEMHLFQHPLQVSYKNTTNRRRFLQKRCFLQFSYMIFAWIGLSAGL